jgi:transcriptional regulator with XRE-family HTH domain
MELAKFMGERIRRARERKGWNQSELARRVQKSRQHLFLIEKGQQQPRCELLRELALVLEVTTDYLYGLSDELERERDCMEVGT